MNIIFLTLVNIDSLNERGIYHDLMRKFASENHNLTIVTPLERRKKIATNFTKKGNVNFLKVKTFNITKTNIFEKGLATIAIEQQYLNAIQKYCSDIKFDLVLYSTPPITFGKVIEYIKKRDNAFSYLLLKDIFPQNAVDMKMIKKNGFIHKYFLNKEKKLYEISDFIGCMSEANEKYLLNKNTHLNQNKIEINPNSIEPIEINYTSIEKNEIKLKYNLPLDKIIYVYGGNLGKPQGIDFLIETIEKCEVESAFFLIIGTGTEFNRILKWFELNKPKNAILMKGLPKNEYDKLLAVCDIGLIFLHKDFEIPNFPCRLLSYLEMKKPILVASDPNTDIGDIVIEHKCGFKVISGDIKEMNNSIKFLSSSNLNEIGLNSWKLLQDKYLVDNSYNLIINKIK